jgi:PAS domain S-box-containing protein
MCKNTSKCFSAYRNYLSILFGIAILAGFYVISQYNYLLFHTLVETLAVIVACAVFILFWNTRRFLDNGFFLFIGIACLFAGMFDLMHALSYKGISVFSGNTGDESIQLKTAGRWLASMSFLIAPLFFRRRINLTATLVAYSAFFAVVLYAIFRDLLPDFYVAESGMTLFQQISRGISCVIFLAAAGVLIIKRKELDAQVFGLFLASLIASSLSELASAVSVDFFGFLKVIAHLAQIISLYFIYKAFIKLGLTKPYNLLFRSMKQSEEMLREREEKLSNIIRNATEIIYTLSPQGIYTFVSPAWTIKLGHDVAEVEGQSFTSFILPEDVPVFRGFFEKVMTAREPQRRIEYRVRHKNGTLCWHASTGSAIRDKQGNSLCYVGVAEDVTEHKRAEAQLARAKEAAESANRAKSEFLANMSHEIRTPMTAILGFADILLDNPTSQEVRELAGIIKRNGEHLLHLINDILDLSKIEAGKNNIELTPCSPTKIIEEVISTIKIRADAKALPLDLEYEQNIPGIIETDPTRLRQILVNLIGNAIKFTEVGGVRIVMGFDAGSAHETKLKFDIIDTGIGLSKEDMDLLFQPFFQVDTSMRRQYGGTGLGLAISRRLAKILGGDITVSSVLGKGSTFSLTIAAGPLKGLKSFEHPADAAQQHPRDAFAESIPGSRILLAEDGPDNQRLIAFILRKAGAEVTVAENGLVAVNLALEAEKVGTPFDIIIMDMQMPVMDGYDATRQLRNAGSKLPIIALTAHAMLEDRRKCIEAGCDSYVTKPLDAKLFLRSIGIYMAKNTSAVEAGS